MPASPRDQSGLHLIPVAVDRVAQLLRAEGRVKAGRCSYRTFLPWRQAEAARQVIGVQGRRIDGEQPDQRRIDVEQPARFLVERVDRRVHFLQHPAKALIGRRKGAMQAREQERHRHRDQQHRRAFPVEGRVAFIRMDRAEAHEPEEAADGRKGQAGTCATGPSHQSHRDQVEDGEAPGVAGRVVEQGDQDRENEGEGEGQRAVSGCPNDRA